MASTRRATCRAEHCIEQRENKQELAYRLYHHSSLGRPVQPRLPCAGVTPSRMAKDQLCSNSVDVESRLKGLGTGNMLEKDKVVLPELNGLAPVAFFERMAMPRPALGGVVALPPQRPFPVPQ